MTVNVIKYSQFPNGGTLVNPDMPVGLESGANTIWTFTGSGGGGGSTSQTFPQQVPAVVAGTWVKITPVSGAYTDGQADTAADGEIIGLVVQANATTFTVQQSGYVTTAMAVPTIVGLSPGVTYFLDTATMGAMVPVDAVINNQISRPVFIADTPTSGWIYPYRPMIVGGAAAQGGGGGSTDSNIVVVNQTAHGFVTGNILYVNTPASGGAVTYAKALATAFNTSQAVGIVIAYTVNQFTLQFAGYNTGAVTVDDLGNPVVAPNVYYVSPTTAGMMTSINPIVSGQFSRPIYVPEQTTANVSINAGYILPQRPLDFNGLTPGIHTVIQNNTFNPGQWVYITGTGAYALGQANTLATSQIAGMIISASSTQFTVQQDGWNTGALATVGGVYPYVDGTPATLTLGAVYYLSPINAGNITLTVPTAINQVTKPCYVQENGSTFTGEILPQRPLLITSTPTGTSGFQLIQSFNLTNGQTVLDTGAMFFNGTYSDIKVIGRDIVFNNVGNNFLTTGFAMQVYLNGVLQILNYVGTNNAFANYALFNSGHNSAVITTNTAFHFDFDLEIKSINSTDNYKAFIADTTAGGGPGQAGLFNYAPSGVLSGPPFVPSSFGSYVAYNSTNTSALTGLHFFFPAAGDIFVSGQISFYGVIA